MFSETDYKSYFNALKQTDEQMFENTEMILSELTDPSIRETVSKIRDDERFHMELEDELFEILESQKEHLAAD